MWISDEYYDELLKVLSGFAKHKVDFDEERFIPFDSDKYNNVTELLKAIKANTKAKMNTNIEIMTSLKDGSYSKIDTATIKDNDFKVFYEKYNLLVNHHERISGDILKLQQSIKEHGNLDVRIDVGEVSGKWLDFINHINVTVESLSTQIKEVFAVIESVASGQLDTKMRMNTATFEVSGNFLNLATVINTMVDQLNAFTSEVSRVAKDVGTEGILGGQAKVEGVSGIWLELTNNVNGMADNLTTQVRNIAEVTTAVAQGDLTKKITVDAKGEVLTLKGTINVMVDQLSAFSSEVSRVAKDVGTEGILGGQAKVEGVSGIWLELTNNVNGMADNLTTQVRGIIAVAKAVIDGDLTASIDIDTRGELLELKKNIDKMINALAFVEETNKNQNWIKDGVSSLNVAILDNNKLVDQIDTSIIQLSRYVNACMGAFYLYDKESKTLRLEGSYAYTKRADIANNFKVGEGIVGQVAYEKKPILLTNVPDGPIIQSGTTKAKALNTYTYPLIFKYELIGVVEVASYEKFNTVTLEYIDSALMALTGSLYVAIQANATSNLLVKSNVLTKELEDQSLQLKSQNKELEGQRQSLDTQRQELEIKNSDLALVQVEVSKRAQELEHANRYKSEFLANMSHELRTPLNSMLLLANSLSKVKDIEPEKLNKQAGVIYDAGNSLLNLINDILDLSKIEAKLMTLNLEDVHISSLLRELKELFMPQAEEKSIQFDITIDADALSVFSTDKSKITQILRNFLSNAIKFTDNDGNISIEVTLNTEDDKKLRPMAISVIDNGIGIDEDKIGLVFDAFKQANGTTSRQYGGTGLGLSISKELTALLGGRIAVKSAIAKGSTFSLFLPFEINTDSIDKDLVEHIQYENIPVTARRVSNKISIIDDREKLNKQDTVILIVEDDAVFANIILQNVHKLGHKAILACDGNTAISMAKEYMPSAIILDILLPIINGIEVLRILKSDINTRHIPIKILSCTEPKNIAEKLGAIDFITKPIQADALNKFITGLVDSVQDKEKRILVIDDDKVQAKYLEALLIDKDVTVKTVGTAKQALKEVLSHKYDCAIVDVNLPDMSGLKILKLIEQENIHLPLIIYTAIDLTDAELAKIRKYSDAVVFKTGTSNVKLIEEVSLFLDSLEDARHKDKQKLLAQAISSELALKGKKILMVDDDVRNIYALSSVLENIGLDISSAPNGKDALAQLKDTQNKFDIVLMDIMMPVMDGYEAMREIRKDNKIKNIPIIALTAKAQAEDNKLCIDAGANDYITKPIDYEQLISLLKVWLIRKPLIKHKIQP
jgi:CheY-like chemotaxis protein/HAMP domain-containing protein